MAAYDLEEQEQLSAIKAWWEKNGNRVTSVLLGVALVVAGAQGWRWYQARQAAEVGALFSVVLQAEQAQDAAKFRVLADELIDKHGNMAVAELTAMLAAKSALDAGDHKAAQGKLEWAVNNGVDPLLRDMARLRLASLLLQDKDFQAALKALEMAPAQAFVARFEDLRGDILFAQGEFEPSRAAYKKSLDAISQQADQQASSFRAVVQTKLDALGGA